MLKRIWSLFKARNLEFLRDRSSLGWNIVLPILLIAGLSYVFSGTARPLFKVAVFPNAESIQKLAFANTQYIDFITAEAVQPYTRKISRHQIDLLIDTGSLKYWVSSSSPKGYFLEKILLTEDKQLTKVAVDGKEISYSDWVLPGILGMNMMFSCLFGVGYVIVRYRKSGYLKRLNATPLTAFEFVIAQVFSRLILIMSITSAVYVGAQYSIGFTMNGSYLLLFFVTLLGALSMISLGLLVSARVSSEELAGGLLNLASWPMMVLSNVWFSIEGSPHYVQLLAECMPLTQLMNGVRAIMIDGATLSDIAYPCSILAFMTILFLGLASSSFKWTAD